MSLTIEQKESTIADSYKDINLWSILARKDNRIALEYLLNEKAKELISIGNEVKKMPEATPMKRREFFKEMQDVKKFVESYLDAKTPNCITKYRNWRISDVLNSEELDLDNTMKAFSIAAGSITSLALNQVPDNIKAQVMLLGLSGLLAFINIPQWEHIITKVNNINEYNMTRDSRGTVWIKKDTKQKVLPIFGHEYTHALQLAKAGLFYRDWKEGYYMAEGHARGMQRILSRTYHEKTDDLAFMHNIADYDAGELQSVYIFLNEWLSLPYNKNIPKIISSRNEPERKNRSKKKIPTEHAIGNALFSIYEAKHGPSIYKDYYHGKFNFK